MNSELEKPAASRLAWTGILLLAVCCILLVGCRTRPVHPVIRDEVYRIGREAVVDALRHAHAKRIEVEVEYKVMHLRNPARRKVNE